MRFLPLLAALSCGVLPAWSYDSVVVFNELHYHPAAGQQEFVELRNLHGVDVNMAGWRMSGGADFVFPEGTVIPGHGYLTLGNIPGALGAFSGALNNAGETIRLRNRNGRIMDELSWEDGGKWPEGPDGSGFTMARRGEDAASGPGAWTTSAQPGGTPGAENFFTGTAVERNLVEDGAVWAFYDATSAPPQAWTAVDFNDTTWQEGPASFGNGTSAPAVLTVTSNLLERFRAGAITGVPDGGVVNTWTDTAVADGASQNATAGGTNPILRLNGTPSGQPVVRFDGTDELRTTALPGIGSTSGFCYWIVLKGNGNQSGGGLSDGSGDYIFDRELTGAGQPLVSLKVIDGKYGLQKRYDDGGGLGGPVTTSAISQTAWQIVAVRRNRTAGRFELWVNGVMEATEPDSGGPLTPDPINIGRYTGGSSQGFIGDIAELLIYGHELSAADFQAAGSYLEAAYGLDTAFPGNSPATVVSGTHPVSYYRHSFNYAGVATQTSLRLSYSVSDGAAFYLNGTEIHRVNLPAGDAGHTTMAVADAPSPTMPGFIPVPSSALRTGNNVLAVSVHGDAAAPGTWFSAALDATETPEDPAQATGLAFNEITGATDENFFVEIKNISETAVDLTGWTVQASSGQTAALPAQPLAAGELLVLDWNALGFTPADNSKLFLLGPGGTRLSSARSVTARLRALTGDGLWGYPSSPTPGTPNLFTINRDVVINEIFYHAANNGPEQWIELHNKGNAPADISGWQFQDAVDWTFSDGTVIPPGGFVVAAWDPVAFSALYPGITAQGPWTRNLSGKGETITLTDAARNVTDTVTYGDGGRWSSWADGGGSSLELRDPLAHNDHPAAWDSSDESGAMPWQNFTLTGTGAHATTSNLTYFHELVAGLLDAGEILIDDISLKEVNQGNRELIQNGDFESGDAAGWRLIGTHSQSEVVNDPHDPSNKVLKMVSTGGTEHMNNHASTTLKAGSTYVAANTASTYTLTFRAKWLRGTNRLHTRLYFNRFARQTLLPVPATGGTPGAVNSRRTANLGPALNPALVDPVVPAAGAPALVTIAAADPQGMGSVELFTSVNGAAFSSIPMTGNAGRFSAMVPAQTAGTQVQFYVRATDAAGAVSLWPTAGPASRAMIPWQDGKTQKVTPAGARPRNLRVVLPAADANFLYRIENVQSNQYLPCTVILDDSRAWYEASTRLKSSEHGRFQQNRVGFNLKFGSDDPFMGAHETISVDRSGNRTTEGLDGSTVTSQREILTRAVMNAAGGIYTTEDDLIRIIPPVASGQPPPAFTGTAVLGQAILSKSRFDDEYLDGQWENGSDGPMFKQEYIYPLSQTINPVTRAVATISSNGNLNATAEQPKISQTGGSPGPGGISVRAYTPPAGMDIKENHRWHWLIRNKRSEDDYSGLLEALSAMGQGAANFKARTEAAIDVDTWMRAVVPAQLFGITDNYLATTGATHNFLLYFPPGGKATAIPWDMDFLGQSSPSAGITNGGDITKFISNGANKRRYYGHVLDVLNRSFNNAFLTRWATHYSTFGPDDMTTSLSFLRARATFVRNLLTGSSAPVPVTPFALTSPETMETAALSATLTGRGWIDVNHIRLQGNPSPLEVTWTSQNAWSLQLPLRPGTFAYNLEAVRPDGSIAGTAAVTVTSTSTTSPASSENIVISRLHYHPAAPSPAETAAGFSSPDDFEYLELQNISSGTIDLSQASFVTGISYTFAEGTLLPPGGRLVLPRRSAAFALRHPGMATAPEYLPADDPDSNKLADGGETLLLQSAGGEAIKHFSYGDRFPWPAAADGGGPALILLAAPLNPDHGNPANWQASQTPGGAPGTAVGQTFSGTAGADADANGQDDLLDFAMGDGPPPSASLSASQGAITFLFTMERDWNANAGMLIEVATDPSTPGLSGWQTATGTTLIERTPLTGTRERLVFEVPVPANAARAFIRARFQLP